MKKRILQIIVLVIAILALLTQYSVATYVSPEDPFSTNIAGNNLEEQIDKWGNDGKGDTTSNDGNTLTNVLEVFENVVKVIATALGEIVAIIPTLINIMMSIFVTGGTSNFTIQDLLLGNYSLFHINVFDVANLTGANSEMIISMSNSVATWYVAVRNLSIIGAAIVLIYVGIRMAISSVAEDKAKYKIMLKSWVIGIILMFLLQYIVLVLMQVSELFINLIKNAIQADTNVIGMENEIINNAYIKIAEIEGLDKWLYIIIYFAMVYYQFKFFVMYIMRVLKINFLIIISPLICMTYPIDTIGDGKAQAFNNWTKQIIMEIFIQAIHLSIYIVFLYSAGEIATEMPLLAVLFFVALSNGERIVRKVFKVEGKGLKDIKLPKI